MIKNIIWLMPMMILMGCKTVPGPSFDTKSETRLEEAENALYQSEYYRARSIVEEVLDENPSNQEARDLMASILEEEISRHKALYEESVPEEWDTSEKNIEIRNWLERSETLLKARQYDQALYAAEKVFLYDPDSLQASRLVDEIGKEAMLNGHSEMLIKGQMINEETNIRLDRYRKQAREAIKSGRFGEAKHVLQKLLILSPEDPIGLELLTEVENQRSMSM